MLVDSHCHLDVAEFDADRDAVIDRARRAGVVAQIVPAIDAAHWEGLRTVCAASPDLFPAYGLHPLLLAQHRDAHLDALRLWLERERPCAIGECGLDFYVEGLDAARQQEILDAQLRLARDFDLPVILHARRAVDAVVASLRRVGGLRGVVHSWSGSQEQAAQLWRLGFHLGIGGPVTYPRAQRLRRIVETMPLEWLLLETDAPDQPLAGTRGERNEPAQLTDVARVVAELRGMEFFELASATTRNAQALFALPL
jgi:TatD DNase family protein